MTDKLIFDIENVSDSYIELFTNKFIEKNINIINGLSYRFYKESSKLSMLSFKEIISNELKKACYSFVNNEHNPDYIEQYLFSCIHKNIKNMNSEGKKSAYICPGCKYMSKLEILDLSFKKLSCNSCKNSLNTAKNKWEENFYKTFSEHSRTGFRCPDCDNFIPDNEDVLISCPYPNCFFVGSTADLNKVRHPSIKANLEISMKNNSIPDTVSSDTGLIVKDNLNEYMCILNECIESQINLIQYKSNNSTLTNKLCMYEAYKNIIKKFPEEMVSYLVLLNRNVRIQHKIFQEFVFLLEEKIPFSFKKSGKIYEITSLLDDNLCVFEGMTEFSATVNHKMEIPNLTTDLYVGGRKGTYCRPYYIGKILSIIDIDTGADITNKIKDYSFFKIVMNNEIKPETNVNVKHLMIPPHYQMGAMVYLNRIRRAIVDRVYFLINGKKRLIKND